MVFLVNFTWKSWLDGLEHDRIMCAPHKTISGTYSPKLFLQLWEAPMESNAGLSVSAQSLFFRTEPIILTCKDITSIEYSNFFLHAFFTQTNISFQHFKTALLCRQDGC